jgi:hypothetical protein
MTDTANGWLLTREEKMVAQEECDERWPKHEFRGLKWGAVNESLIAHLKCRRILWFHFAPVINAGHKCGS